MRAKRASDEPPRDEPLTPSPRAGRSARADRARAAFGQLGHEQVGRDGTIDRRAVPALVSW